MAEAFRKRLWARRLTWAAALLSLGGVVVALIGAVGSGQGLWHFRTGFLVLRYAFFAVMAGGVLAIAALLMVRRNGLHGLTRLNMAALIVAVIFVTYVGHMVRTARRVPPIHDISTNLADVPSFHRLRVRDDNLADVPDMGRPDLARLAPRDRWRAIHAASYGDLHTLHVPWDVAETVARAEEAARDRGWQIVTVDKDRGVVEAVDTSLFFRFKDNIVVRVRPDPVGGSAVDVRSISRVGISDVGVNARRVRAFLDAMRPDPGEEDSLKG